MDDPLGFALGAAARKLAKFYVQALQPWNITPAQLYVLRQLWREDALPLKELSARAQLDATSATWIVDQLAKSDLVERQRTDLDRRLVRITLTAAGRAMEAELGGRLSESAEMLEQALYAHHTPTEVTAFRSVLTTIIRTLPEGDDLWATIDAEWDERLVALKELVEREEAPQ